MVKEAEIDQACASCGLIRKGPHTGETVPDISQATEYKGAPISHAGPEECPNCGENARRLRRAGRIYVQTAPNKAEKKTYVSKELARAAAWDETMRSLRKGRNSNDG